MQTTDIISLVTNVGFPVTLCFILLRYVLQTICEKLDRLDQSLSQLAQAIQSIQGKKGKQKLLYKVRPYEVPNQVKLYTSRSSRDLWLLFDGI